MKIDIKTYLHDLVFPDVEHLYMQNRRPFYTLCVTHYVQEDVERNSVFKIKYAFGESIGAKYLRTKILQQQPGGCRIFVFFMKFLFSSFCKIQLISRILAYLYQFQCFSFL